MKKRLLVLPIILMLGLSACSPKVVPAVRKTSVSFFDFSKYANEGFMISPNQYIGEFEPCGDLYLKIIPGEVLKTNSRKSNYSPSTDLIYQSSKEASVDPAQLVKETIGADELLKEAVKQAKMRGANALVNFKCVEVYNHTIGQYITISTLLYYEVSGFAIKRKL